MKFRAQRRLFGLGLLQLYGSQSPRVAIIHPEILWSSLVRYGFSVSRLSISDLQASAVCHDMGQGSLLGTGSFRF